jgi:hypothetical protein
MTAEGPQRILGSERSLAVFRRLRFRGFLAALCVRARARKSAQDLESALQSVNQGMVVTRPTKLFWKRSAASVIREMQGDEPSHLALQQ